jgi:putative ABC transport system substrate-binding protein
MEIRFHFKKNTFFLFAMSVFLLLYLLLSSCPGSKKIYRIGVISSFNGFLKIIDSFKAELAELGYVENENITYDIREVDGDDPGMRKAAREFVESRVDLILSFPTETSLIAKEEASGTGIPVLFANANIDKSGLVESILRPGGNITGIRTMLIEHAIKRLEILIDIMPQAKRIFIPHEAFHPGLDPILAELQRKAESIDITLIEIIVNTAEEMEAHLDSREAAGDLGIDAILVLPTRLLVSEEGFDILNAFAYKHNLPLSGTLPFMTDRGAIFNFALDHDKVGRMAGVLADKIFQGTPAGEIPVLTAEFALRINYKRARELGLEVPESLLALASEIIR